MFFTSGLSPRPIPIESDILSHCPGFTILSAIALATVMIANGTPPHFFRIFIETSANCSGHLSSDPNILP
jgi:hypothetical protein